MGAEIVFVGKRAREAVILAAVTLLGACAGGSAAGGGEPTHAQPEGGPATTDAPVTDAPTKAVERPDAQEPSGEGAAELADGTPPPPAANPLKEKALVAYHAKIASWLNARFQLQGRKQPIPCHAERALMTRTVLKIAPDLTVVEAQARTSSGDAAFDQLVQGTIDGVIGSRIPEPPPIFPDMAPTELTQVYSNLAVPCQSAR